MRYSTKKWLTLAAAFTLCISVFQAHGRAAAASLPDGAAAAPISDATQLSALIQEHWEDSYFDQVVIDPQQETATVDGAPADLGDTLDLTPVESAQVLDSTEAAEDFFSDTAYDAQVTEEGTVVITAPYQTRRIFLYADTLPDAYGATDVLYFEKYGEYILQYATQEDTQAAYSALSAEYGEDRCFVDEVIYADQQLSAAATAADCYSWGASLMGLDQLKVEAASLKASSTVAIVDTGIDDAHTLFQGRTISPDSYNFTDNSDNLSDPLGHGTHVAGIVADCTPKNVTLLILRVYNDAGQSTVGIVDAALKAAVDDGADVINMSLGWVSDSASSYTFLDQAIAAAYQANIPIFCAAGNNADTVLHSYPACNSQTLAVSAIKSSGAFASSYSNYGEQVDFAAPGDKIVSAWIGGGSQTESGTSMACPHLAAAAAYIKLREPDATVTDIYKTLQSYAVDAGAPGRDTLYGWGYVTLPTFLQDNPGGSHPLSAMTVTLSQSRYTYDGKAKKPTVTLKEKGKVVSPHNYTVSYKNNKQIGTATVTLTGIANYTGTLTKTFSIKAGSTAISSVSNGAKGVQVTWKQTAAATGYTVYRRAGSGSWKKAKTIGKGTTVSWTDTAVSNGTSYHYLVRPLYGSTQGGYKGIKAIRRLSQPTITSLKRRSATSLKLTWKKNTKATGYQIQYSTGSSFKTYKTITGKSYKTVRRTITRLSKNKRYYVRLRAYRTISGKPHYSAWSATKSVNLKK